MADIFVLDAIDRLRALAPTMEPGLARDISAVIETVEYLEADMLRLERIAVSALSSTLEDAKAALADALDDLARGDSSDTTRASDLVGRLVGTVSGTRQSRSADKSTEVSTS